MTKTTRTRLYLGPARNAELLEVVTIIRDDESELVIHAMKTSRSIVDCSQENDDG